MDVLRQAVKNASFLEQLKAKTNTAKAVEVLKELGTDPIENGLILADLILDAFGDWSQTLLTTIEGWSLGYKAQFKRLEWIRLEDGQVGINAVDQQTAMSIVILASLHLTSEEPLQMPKVMNMGTEEEVDYLIADGGLYYLPASSKYDRPVGPKTTTEWLFNRTLGRSEDLLEFPVEELEEELLARTEYETWEDVEIALFEQVDHDFKAALGQLEQVPSIGEEEAASIKNQLKRGIKNKLFVLFNLLAGERMAVVGPVHTTLHYFMIMLEGGPVPFTSDFLYDIFDLGNDEIQDGFSNIWQIMPKSIYSPSVYADNEFSRQLARILQAGLCLPAGIRNYVEIHDVENGFVLELDGIKLHFNNDQVFSDDDCRIHNIVIQYPKDGDPDREGTQVMNGAAAFWHAMAWGVATLQYTTKFDEVRTSSFMMIAKWFKRHIWDVVFPVETEVYQGVVKGGSREAYLRQVAKSVVCRYRPNSINLPWIMRKNDPDSQLPRASVAYSSYNASNYSLRPASHPSLELKPTDIKESGIKVLKEMMLSVTKVPFYYIEDAETVGRRFGLCSSCLGTRLWFNEDRIINRVKHIPTSYRRKVAKNYIKAWGNSDNLEQAITNLIKEKVSNIEAFVDHVIEEGINSQSTKQAKKEKRTKHRIPTYCEPVAIVYGSPRYLKKLAIDLYAKQEEGKVSVQKVLDEYRQYRSLYYISEEEFGQDLSEIMNVMVLKNAIYAPGEAPQVGKAPTSKEPVTQSEPIFDCEIVKNVDGFSIEGFELALGEAIERIKPTEVTYSWEEVLTVEEKRNHAYLLDGMFVNKGDLICTVPSSKDSTAEDKYIYAKKDMYLTSLRLTVSEFGNVKVTLKGYNPITKAKLRSGEVKAMLVPAFNGNKIIYNDMNPNLRLGIQAVLPSDTLKNKDMVFGDLGFAADTAAHHPEGRKLIQEVHKRLEEEFGYTEPLSATGVPFHDAAAYAGIYNPLISWLRKNFSASVWLYHRDVEDGMARTIQLMYDEKVHLHQKVEDNYRFIMDSNGKRIRVTPSVFAKLSDTHKKLVSWIDRSEEANQEGSELRKALKLKDEYFPTGTLTVYTTNINGDGVLQEEDDVLIFAELDESNDFDNTLAKVTNAHFCFWQRTYGYVPNSYGHIKASMKVEYSTIPQNCVPSSEVMSAIPRSYDQDVAAQPANHNVAKDLMSTFDLGLTKFQAINASYNCAQIEFSHPYVSMEGEDEKVTVIDAYVNGNVHPGVLAALEQYGIADLARESRLTVKDIARCPFFHCVALNFNIKKPAAQLLQTGVTYDEEHYPKEIPFLYAPPLYMQDMSGEVEGSLSRIMVELVTALCLNIPIKSTKASKVNVSSLFYQFRGSFRKMMKGEGIWRAICRGVPQVMGKATSAFGIPVGVLPVLITKEKKSVYQHLLTLIRRRGYSGSDADALMGLKGESVRVPLTFHGTLSLLPMEYTDLPPNVEIKDLNQRIEAQKKELSPLEVQIDSILSEYEEKVLDEHTLLYNPIFNGSHRGDNDGDGIGFLVLSEDVQDEVEPVTTEVINASISLSTGIGSYDLNQSDYFADHYNIKPFNRKEWDRSNLVGKANMFFDTAEVAKKIGITIEEGHYEMVPRTVTNQAILVAAAYALSERGEIVMGACKANAEVIAKLDDPLALVAKMYLDNTLKHSNDISTDIVGYRAWMFQDILSQIKEMYENILGGYNPSSFSFTSYLKAIVDNPTMDIKQEAVGAFIQDINDAGLNSSYATSYLALAKFQGYGDSLCPSTDDMPKAIEDLYTFFAVVAKIVALASKGDFNPEPVGKNLMPTPSARLAYLFADFYIKNIDLVQEFAANSLAVEMVVKLVDALVPTCNPALWTKVHADNGYQNITEARCTIDPDLYFQDLRSR